MDGYVHTQWQVSSVQLALLSYQCWHNAENFVASHTFELLLSKATPSVQDHKTVRHPRETGVRSSEHNVQHLGSS
jgi:hypothetical protein